MNKIFHEMLDPGYWANASLAKRLFIVRVPELALLAVLGIISLSYLGADADAFFIPDVVALSINTTTAVASFNPLFAYPLHLDGFQCDPGQLSLCLSDLSTERQEQGCCTSLQNVNIYPEETVDNKKQYLIICGVAAPIITLRILFWRKFFCDEAAKRLTDLFWLMVWWDSAVCCLVTAAYTATAINILKFGIGYPRPIYYALTVFSSVHESARQQQRDAATLSMPSGHAGMSMCVFSMVAALLLSDAYYFLKMPQQEGRQYYKLLGYAAFGIMLLPIYIGVTRIYDYYHFAADVIVGWFLGMFFTAFTFTFHCNLNGFFMAVKRIKFEDGFGNELLSHDRENAS